MLQSGDQVGTKEMSERKQLSPPPETLLALFNLSLPFYVCLICGEPDSLKKTRNHSGGTILFSFPSETTLEIRPSCLEYLINMNTN